MKFYIASSFKNKELVRVLANELKLQGFVHTCDWTMNERADSLELLALVGESEKQAVATSDFLVILLPGGKGSHIEMGIALGLGKRVYLYSPTNEIYDFDKTSTFYHVEGVTRFVGTIEAFTGFLLGQEGVALTENVCCSHQ